MERKKEVGTKLKLTGIKVVGETKKKKKKKRNRSVLIPAFVGKLAVSRLTGGLRLKVGRDRGN